MTQASTDQLAILYTVSGSTLTTVGEVTALDLPELKVPTVDVTNTSSPRSGSTVFSESISTQLASYSDVSFDMNFIKSQFTSIQSLAVAGTLQPFKAVLNDSGSTTFPFSAIVNSVKPNKIDIGKGNYINATMKATISGSALYA